MSLSRYIASLPTFATHRLIMQTFHFIYHCTSFNCFPPSYCSFSLVKRSCALNVWFDLNLFAIFPAKNLAAVSALLVSVVSLWVSLFAIHFAIHFAASFQNELIYIIFERKQSQSRRCFALASIPAAAAADESIHCTNAFLLLFRPMSPAYTVSRQRLLILCFAFQFMLFVWLPLFYYFVLSASCVCVCRGIA